MRRSGERRLWWARELGRTGAWLALVLMLGSWVGSALLVIPAQAALNGALAELGSLDAQLAQAQATLAPFDVIGRPETLEAVRTLNNLAESAQRTPIVDTLFGPQSLRDAVALTADWEKTLRERPPFPALQEARDAVQTWSARLQAFQARLWLLASALALVFTLLCAWFGLGQWALYQWASKRLVSPERQATATK